MNLIVFALKEEDDLPDYPGFIKIYTGVGKVNASYSLVKAIEKYSPDLVINLGTAGGVSLKKGDFVKCESFVQIDMNCSSLGWDRYQTPYEKVGSLKYPILGTSDTFISEKINDIDLVDMEAFALKKICDLEKINFECYKYITDECDTCSKNDWNSSIKHANKYYSIVMERHLNENSSYR